MRIATAMGTSWKKKSTIGVTNISQAMSLMAWVTMGLRSGRKVATFIRMVGITVIMTTPTPPMICRTARTGGASLMRSIATAIAAVIGARNPNPTVVKRNPSRVEVGWAL